MFGIALNVLNERIVILSLLCPFRKKKYYLTQSYFYCFIAKRIKQKFHKIVTLPHRKLVTY